MPDEADPPPPSQAKPQPTEAPAAVNATKVKESCNFASGDVEQAAKPVESASAAPVKSAKTFKWGNPKSRPTYGHTFDEHGQKLTEKQLHDRARAKGHQIGQYQDDQKAANFIAEVAKSRGPGVHTVDLPPNMPVRSVLPNGDKVVPDKAIVVVKPDGSVRTSYPFSSAHPTQA